MSCCDGKDRRLDHRLGGSGRTRYNGHSMNVALLNESSCRFRHWTSKTERLEIDVSVRDQEQKLGSLSGGYFGTLVRGYLGHQENTP